MSTDVDPFDEQMPPSSEVNRAINYGLQMSVTLNPNLKPKFKVTMLGIASGDGDTVVEAAMRCRLALEIMRVRKDAE